MGTSSVATWQPTILRHLQHAAHDVNSCLLRETAVNIIVTHVLLVHHIWSRNSIVSAPAPEEMRPRQQAVKRMDGWVEGGREGGRQEEGRAPHIHKPNSRLWACSWSVIQSARACVCGTEGSWQWSGRRVARQQPPCRRRRTSELLRSEREKHGPSSSISGDHKSHRALITSGLLTYTNGTAWFLKAHPKAVQCYFYKLCGGQSNRQPHWAISFKAPSFWLYTQSESNKAVFRLKCRRWGAPINSV